MGRHVNIKALLLLALVVCCAVQAVVGRQEVNQRPRRRWDHREFSPEKEEEIAEEEERRRREGEEEEEEMRPRPPHRRRRDPREEQEEEEQEKEEEDRPRRIEEKEKFLLGEAKRVLSSEAGEMRIVKGSGYGSHHGGGGRDRQGCGSAGRSLHIGLITMEPRSLFVPQYWDSTLVIFIRRGEAKLGLIYKDDLVERRLKTGDVYRIPAGSTFYIANTAEGQRLHIIAAIDPSEGLGIHTFEPFFIGGGANPASVLAGFNPQTLSTAFNVSVGELRDIMTSQEAGPFVFTDSHVPYFWTNFHSLTKEERAHKLSKLASSDDDDETESKWSYWRNLITNSIMGDNKKKAREGETRHGPDSFNLFNVDPDFRNNYGWSVAVDKNRYHQLKKACIGVYYVNLTAGSMMAPHINPIATEYGIVTEGSGSIEIIYPNGTKATSAKIREGSVFRVPRYFPFCHIASRSGPLEFFGFTTSARRNHPQFLVGASSILRTMAGPEFAAAFGITMDRFREIVDAQRETVILPTPGAAPGGEREEGGERRQRETGDKERAEETKKRLMKSVAKDVGNKMVIDF